MSYVDPVSQRRCQPNDKFFSLNILLNNKSKGTRPLSNLLSSVQKEIKSDITPKQHNALKLILFNFILNDFYGLIISKDNNHYKVNQKRYNKAGVGYDPFIAALGTLESNGLVTYRYRATPHILAKGTRSIIDATDKLKELCSPYNDRLKTHLKNEPELIELTKNEKLPKGKKRRLHCDYKDTLLSKSNRAFLKDYNQWISSFVLSCDVPEEVYSTLDEEAQEAADTFKGSSSLRRVFNAPADYEPHVPEPLPERGGRLYGASHQHFPKELRQYITINGNRTAEADYRALGPNLLYLEVTGAPCKHYPYEVCLSNGAIIPVPLVKKIMTVAVNVPTRAAIQGAARDKFKEHKNFLTANKIKAKDVIQAILQQHQPIAHFFPGEDRTPIDPIGMTLQFQDSQIMLSLLQQCYNDKVPMYPIHDSCIVQEQHKEYIQKLMFQKLMKAFDCTGEGIDMALAIKLEENYQG